MQPLSPLLRGAVAVSFIVCLASLTILVVRTFSFGKRPLRAGPRGSAAGGIAYAFGAGMMPWEKESARKHIPTYTAGILYHAGIFASFFALLAVIIPFEIGELWQAALHIFLAAGFAAGTFLLAKRMLVPAMRPISCPDDFASNIIVTIFIASAFTAPFVPVASTVLAGMSILVLLYIPLGKIRHCFFFFYTRILFGLFFGRRGVLPHHAAIEE